MDNWKLGIFFLDRAPTVSSERIGMWAFHTDAFGGFSAVIGDFPQF